MDRSSRQKINKETLALKDTLECIQNRNKYIIDIYIYIKHPIQSKQNTQSSQVHIEHFPNYTLCQSITQVLINLQQKSDPALFSSHNSMKLEVNYTKKTAKLANKWRLNNMLPNCQWFSEEMKNILRQMKMEIWQMKS